MKGELSLGVEKVTNTILVTAKGEQLLKIISDMIEQLDQAAKPSGSVEVLKVDGGTNSESLAKALKAMLKVSQPNDQQQQMQQQQGNPTCRIPTDKWKCSFRAMAEPKENASSTANAAVLHLVFYKTAIGLRGCSSVPRVTPTRLCALSDFQTSLPTIFPANRS